MKSENRLNSTMNRTTLPEPHDPKYLDIKQTSYILTIITAVQKNNSEIEAQCTKPLDGNRLPQHEHKHRIYDQN
jgi:hypothetical protein